MENKEFIKYFELETEDGPLYFYEKYKSDPNVRFNSEMPVTKEFFTGEEGIRGFNTIDFLDRKCVFDTYYYSILGELMDTYKHELTPYEFLEKVFPFLETEEAFRRKREEVLNMLEYKAKLTTSRKVKKRPPEISSKTKDEMSQMILKKYLK